MDFNKLIGNTDAMMWAKMFVDLIKKKPEIATDEGTMLGRFANAIMAGYDKNDGKKSKDAHIKWIAEYCYRKANPQSKMDIPSIVYEQIEKDYNKFLQS